MKKFRIFLFYLTYCLLPIDEMNRIPPIINYHGSDYFSIVTKYTYDWKLTYEKNLSSYAREILFETTSTLKYFVYLKMLWVLWKNRKKISFEDTNKNLEF